jgi:hypothetical protein
VKLGVIAVILPIFVYAGIAATAPSAQEVATLQSVGVNPAPSVSPVATLLVSLVTLFLSLGSFVVGLQARRRKNGMVRRLIGSRVKEVRGVPLVEKSKLGFRVIVEGNDFTVKKEDRGKINDGVQNVVSYLQDGGVLFVLGINGKLVGDLGGGKA